MALAMALTRVIFSLPNMSLITLALRNEEEPKTKHVASRVKDFKYTHDAIIMHNTIVHTNKNNYLLNRLLQST